MFILIYSDIINLLLINNYYTRNILYFFYQNNIDDETDYELSFLRKKIYLLLNDNSQNFLEYNINYGIESYNKICKLYFELNKFIINERIFKNINININHIINSINNIVYRSDFGLTNLYNSEDLYKFINNSVYNQIISLDNYNKIFEHLILAAFYINNQIDNTISDNNYNLLHFNFLNSIGNEKKVVFEKNKYSLAIYENKKKLNSKKIKNTKCSCKIKRNIFKVIRKVSRYKGVTKNKKKWQAYIRIYNKNTYLGSYKSEKIAAIIYDLMSIKKNGSLAKTNFKYNTMEIKKISKLELDINNFFKVASEIKI